MRKASLIAAAGLLTVGIGAVPFTAGAATAAKSDDLALTATVVGGVKEIGSGKVLVIEYHVTNDGKINDNGDILQITSTSGATYVDSSCIEDGFAGNGDGDLCEYNLNAGRSYPSLYLYRADDDADYMTIKACVTGSYTDPKPSNNCTTTTVPVD